MNIKITLDNVMVPVLKILGRLGWRPKRVSAFFLSMRDYQAHLDRIASHCGRLTAAKYGKSLYSASKRLALGLPDVPQSGPLWFKTRKGHSLPPQLWRLERFLRCRSRPSRMVALLVMSSYQLIDHRPEFSLDSCLQPSTWSEPFGLRRAFSLLYRNYNLGRLHPRRYVNFETFISSSGVHGGPSSFGLDTESVMDRPPYNDMVNDCVELIKYARDKYFDNAEAMGSYASLRRRASDFRVLQKRPRVPTRGRLVFLSEGGGKTRVVTPVSYFIQVVLKHFHEHLMEMLRRIPSDCSFDEQAGLDRVKAWSSLKRNLYSFDLSNATDRFPVQLLSSLVIGRIYGRQFATRWLRIMSLYLAVRTPLRKDILVRFAVGAPMGLYTLWPAFTLAHHSLVVLASVRAGYPPSFRDYVIRGDDIVICGREVALQYERILSQLDLDVSYSKSYRADRDGPGVAEFAKRVFLNGQGYNLRPIREVRAAFRHDPFRCPEVVRDLLDLFCPHSLAKSPVCADCSGLRSLLTIGLRPSRVHGLLRYLETPFGATFRSYLKPLKADLDPSWNFLADEESLEYAKSAGLEILRRDLLKDLDEVVLNLPLDNFGPSHPLKRLLTRLREEVDTLSTRVFGFDASFRDSSIILAVRQIRGLNLRDIRRRNVRLLVSSRYVSHVLRAGMRTSTRRSLRLGYW